MNYILEGENLAKKIALRLKLLLIPCAGNEFKPHFLQSDALLFIAVVLLLARLMSVGFFIPWPQNFLFADITKIHLVNLLNQNRQSLGLDSLHDNPKLDEAAMLKAKDMVANGYFAHQSPTGVTPWYWFLRAGYAYKYAGENLAVGFMDSSEVFNAWLNSPEHRANLHNPNYQDVGTAVLPGFDGNAIVVVQEFGSPPAGGAFAKPATTVAVNKKPAPILPAPLAPVKIVSGTGSQMVAPAAEIEPKVLGQSVNFIQAAATQEAPSKGLYYYLIRFIANDYQDTILYFSYLMLLAVSVAFLVNAFASLQIVRGALMLRSLALIGMFYTAAFVNQSILLQILPHTVNI